MLSHIYESLTSCSSSLQQQHLTITFLIIRKKELQKQPHKQGRNTTTPHRKDRSGILGLNRGLCYCKLLIVYIKLDCIKLHTQKILFVMPHGVTKKD